MIYSEYHEGFVPVLHRTSCRLHALILLKGKQAPYESGGISSGLK